jgi:protein-S-isoprenylcysteine O-methyltransferase Ste14
LEVIVLLLLKNILFTILVPGTVAVYIPLRIAARPAAPPSIDSTARQILALLLLSLGAAIYLWCLWHFAVTGRGTPAPIDAPKKLVVQGLYRYVRNPMYVGVLVVIAGWAMFFQSISVLVYAAVVALLFQLFVVLVEEPILERKFGEAYEKYREEVGRWVPRIWRRRAA